MVLDPSYVAPTDRLSVAVKPLEQLTRREMLKAGLAGLGGLCASTLASKLLAAGIAKDHGVATAPKTADVHEINERRLLDNFDEVRGSDYLPFMVDRLIQKMAGVGRASKAWREFFSPKDTIGIKFDRVAAEFLRTSQPMAMVLLKALKKAGLSYDKIMVIEGPHTPGIETMAVPFGYEQEAAKIAADRKTHFLRALSKITAILNVPLLKDHRKLGLACGTVNLTLGMVNNPGTFFDNGGDPAVAQLFARDEIHKKHRLTLVNGIRGIYDGGPRGERGQQWNQCSILGSTDCIAVDRVAADLIDAARFSRNLKSLAEAGRPPKYLDAAHTMGLGVGQLSQINIHRAGI